VIIEDIRPAADLHLLVIPKRHIRDITTVDDAKILDSLLMTARAHLPNFDVMEDKNVGFHQPPFNSQVYTRNKQLFLRIFLVSFAHAHCCGKNERETEAANPESRLGRR
jgi:hypothetical protein